MKLLIFGGADIVNFLNVGVRRGVVPGAVIEHHQVPFRHGLVLRVILIIAIIGLLGPITPPGHIVGNVEAK